MIMTPSIHTFCETNAGFYPNVPAKRLLEHVSVELESMRRSASFISKQTTPGSSFYPLPTACRNFLRSIPGNERCVDCSTPNPQWASVSYGCLLCLQCSGRHRSYGVSVSRVRSITMDTWSHRDVLAMLEGGNDQLAKFFERHQLSPRNSERSSDKVCLNSSKTVATVSSEELRYKTKAARFYRENLGKHVENIASSGEYQGREAARKRAGKQAKKRSKNECSESTNENQLRRRKSLRIVTF